MRWLDAAVCILALLLALLVGTIWVRGQFETLNYGWMSSSAGARYVDRHVWLVVYKHHVELYAAQHERKRPTIRKWLNPNPAVRVQRFRQHYKQPTPASLAGNYPLLNRLGIAFDGSATSGRSWLRLTVPSWLMLLILSGYPALYAVRWRRRRRWGPGLCQTCGYDLRASVQRCPECGSAIPEYAGEATANPFSGAFPGAPERPARAPFPGPLPSR